MGWGSRVALPCDSSAEAPITRAGARVLPPPPVARNAPPTPHRQELHSGLRGQQMGISPEQLTARDGLQLTLETWGTRSLGGTHPQLQGSAHPPADPTHLSLRPLTAANSCRVTKSASRGREPGLAGQMQLGYSSGLELAVTPRLWDSASPGEMRAEPQLEGFFQPRESRGLESQKPRVGKSVRL